MPARPSDLSRWAYAADPADVVEPSTTLKQEGWQPATRPPAQNFNWVFQNLGDWVHHLQALQVKNFEPRTKSGVVTEWNGVAADGSGLVVVAGRDSAGPTGRLNVVKRGGPRMQTATPASAGTGFGPVVWVGGTINLFVVADAAGNYETSPDGTTWTDRTGATSDAKNGIAWREVDSALLVAVGNNGQVETSTNGTSWTDRTMAATVKQQNWVAHNQVAGGSGLFVSVGEDGDVHTSADGITWTKRTGPSGGADGFDTLDMKSVVYDPSQARWIAVSLSLASGASTTWTSSDGVTWVKRSDTPGEVTSLATDRKGTVLAVGSYVTDDRTDIEVSYDGGLTWENSTQWHGTRYRAVTYSSVSGWWVVGVDYASGALALQSIIV